MDEKKCDHTSVGVIAEKNGEVLLIERRKFPAGFALPAGHCDGDSFEAAALREFFEETGLEPLKIEPLFSAETENPCRRTDGKRHQWQMFHVTEWAGALRQNTDETKSIEWASKNRLRSLAARTEEFAKKYGMLISNMPQITHALAVDPIWQASPGLEPVWYLFCERLGMI